MMVKMVLTEQKAKGDLKEIGAERINKFVDVTVTEKTTTTTGALSLNLHVGADSTDNNKIKLEIESMSSKSLGSRRIKGRYRRWCNKCN